MDSRSRHAAAKLTSAFALRLLRSRGDHLRSRIMIQAARPSLDGLRASPICLFETLRHASSIQVSVTVQVHSAILLLHISLPPSRISLHHPIVLVAVSRQRRTL